MNCLQPEAECKAEMLVKKSAYSQRINATSPLGEGGHTDSPGQKATKFPRTTQHAYYTLYPIAARCVQLWIQKLLIRPA